MKLPNLIKINIIITGFFLVFSALTLAKVQAATYYVSPVGADSYVGSQDKPFKTIQKSANIVTAGDTVYVRGGTYAGFYVDKKNGTSNNWIVFKPYLAESVIINSDLNTAPLIDCIRINGSSYIEVRDFKLTDSTMDYESTNPSIFRSGVGHHGVRIDEVGGVYSSYINIINNTMHRLGGSGMYTGYYTHHVYITDNTIHDVGLSKRGYGLYIAGDDHQILRNEIYNAYGHGVHIYGDQGVPERILVESNKIYNNGHDDYGEGDPNPDYNSPRGDGIIDWTGGTAGNTIRNNIVYGNLHWGIRSVTRNTIILNNTSYNNGRQGIYAEPNKNISIKNNVSINNIGGGGYPGDMYIGTGNVVGTNGITASYPNPKFVNAASGDFYISEDSPLRGKAEVIATPMYDFDGQIRDANPDLGAYEYIAGKTSQTKDTTPPSPPLLLLFQ